MTTLKILLAMKGRRLHLKKGSKRVDTIPVPSVNILTNLKVVVRQFCQKDGNEASN